jgi:predicted phosphoribosyltransferase
MDRKSQTAAVKQNGTKQPSIPAPVTPEQVAAAMERTVQRVLQMSHQQRVQSLKDAGILTAGGKLSASYR